MIRIVLFGGPGVGKGTQASILSERYNIAHISTGDILRHECEAGTQLGVRVSEHMKSGTLVPDDLILDIVAGRIKRDDCENGYILDGFPRTVAQAEAMAEKGIGVDIVISFELSDDEMVERMIGRAHEAIAAGQTVRSDDVDRGVIATRINTFHKMTESVKRYYLSKNFLEAIDGSLPKEEVTNLTATKIEAVIAKTI
jgi:adenylate kinase